MKSHFSVEVVSKRLGRGATKDRSVENEEEMDEADNDGENEDTDTEDSEMSADEMDGATGCDDDEIHLTVSALSLAVDNWVLVEYQNKQYAGQIIQVEDTRFKPNCMHPVPGQQGCWRWPRRRDNSIWYKSIIKRLPESTQNVNAKNKEVTYSFPEDN